MDKNFKKIALIGYPKNTDVIATIKSLYSWLTNKSVEILLDQRLSNIEGLDSEFYALDLIGSSADLAIIIGGDGVMLNAARVLSQFDISVIGINKGNLGFLTDISPENYHTEINGVLAGDYYSENRFLLSFSILRDNKFIINKVALNEVVLHPIQIANLIEFDVFVNKRFLFNQRSDGLIVATPTGSTAYSLSGGGPIISPNLNAITLVPKFPHTLSSRPIVINADNTINLKITSDKNPLAITFDGHETIPLQRNDQVIIKKSKHTLNLIHPNSYDYYNVLRNKLGWSNKFF